MKYETKELKTLIIMVEIIAFYIIDRYLTRKVPGRGGYEDDYAYMNLPGVPRWRLFGVEETSFWLTVGVLLIATGAIILFGFVHFDFVGIISVAQGFLILPMVLSPIDVFGVTLAFSVIFILCAQQRHKARRKYFYES